MNDLTVAKNKLPAHLRNRAVTENAFGAAVSLGGFPVISIKGKVFHVQRGDEKELVTAPDDPDEPARNLEVVIVGINNAKSKVFYEKGYVEGSTDAPTCYSNDGIAPALDAENRQAKKCATCPHNQWGSRITESGAKGKLCQDSMRLAVCPAGQLNDPMLLRVPATSLKTLGNYGTQLAKRATSPEMLITKVGFDYDVAHPALTFKAKKYLDEDQYNEVLQTQEDEAETIGLILGTIEAPEGEVDSDVGLDIDDEDDDVTGKDTESDNSEVEEEDDELSFDDEEEDVVQPKQVAKKANKPTSKKKAAPAKPKGKAKSKPTPKKEAVKEFDDIDSALDDLDWDD